MNFLLETNPAFLILPIDNDEFVFYNSLQHIGARLTHLELLILDLYYKYQDSEYIISSFPVEQQSVVKNALLSIDNLHLLICEDLIDESYKSPMFPTFYYIHPTYKCNLNCTYCYNKTIRRKTHNILPLSDWTKIIDKISGHAKIITFTGGEFLLYPKILPLIKYIKNKYPNIKIAAISNGMHDFENNNISDVFNYISDISFSCDSISREGERKGFNPNLYKKNIKWIREHFPELKISVALTYTSSNAKDIVEATSFCRNYKCILDKSILIPENATEIKLMPDFEEQIQMYLRLIDNKKVFQLNQARIRCGAAKSICSIDPIGDLYPCQSLHYEEFRMGNILHDSIDDIKYLGKEGCCFKTVNDLPVCSKCNVKYICGGGCLASGYKFYRGKIDHNHLLCHLNYMNCIRKLKSLNNRL